MRLVIVGGSDADIEAGLTARQVNPGLEVTLFVADRFPNYSICGIPYHVAGDVPDWRDLAHRKAGTLEAAGLDLRLGVRALEIDPVAQTVSTTGGVERYDRLVISTGANPMRPFGEIDGVHELHTMDDTFSLTGDLETAESAIIIGAGYIGMEMAEALAARGLRVTVLERMDQVMARSLDAVMADELAETLTARGVEVRCGVTVRSIERMGETFTVAGDDEKWSADVVLVVTGVRPNTDLGVRAGVELGEGRALKVDRHMRTGLPGVYAAGDCVHTFHRLLDRHVYLPLGSTAHKQGRVAGENAAGGDREFAGVLGTQVVKVFDRVAAATGLRDAEAEQAGFAPLTVEIVADDHKAYYPGATPIRIRLTGDRATGRLLGAQLLGHLGAEVAKRLDVLATGIHHGISVGEVTDLDLSYTPPLGSPWDAIQQAAREWARLR